MKFDDLCTDFGYHEDLDNSGAVVTMTLKPNGTVSGMNLTSVNATGVIPITIPASMEGLVSTSISSVKFAALTRARLTA